MPYIKQAERVQLDPTKGHGICCGPDSAGQLNFVISKLCNEYVENHGMSYTICNEIVGALECTKLEFYRRIVVPYEEVKLKENGDVY